MNIEKAAKIFNDLVEKGYGKLPIIALDSASGVSHNVYISPSIGEIVEDMEYEGSTLEMDIGEEFGIMFLED